MRNVTVMLLCVFIFNSCIVYRYATVASPDSLQNDQKEFVIENDTVKVVYNFNGIDGPVTIRIYNKSTDQLEIDWRKSAIIVGGKALSYYSPTIKGDFNAEQNQSYYKDYTNVSGNLSAAIHGAEGLEFIPPRAYITRTTVQIGKEIPVPEIPKQKFRSESDKVNAYGSVAIRKISFTKNDSPLLFSSYLTFISGTGGSREFSITHNFYVSEIMTTEESPEYIPEMIQKKGDKFSF